MIIIWRDGYPIDPWEDAAHQFKSLDVPVTILRTGIVLSKTGGALEKMKTPIIAALGSGNQYLAWIHIDDLCYMYVKSIEGNLEGIFNAVAPEHHTSKSFSKVLANKKLAIRPHPFHCILSLLRKINSKKSGKKISLG